MDRASIGTDELVKLAVVLVVVWIALEVLEEVVGLLLAPFSVLRPVLGLILLAILVLFVLDRL